MVNQRVTPNDLLTMGKTYAQNIRVCSLDVPLRLFDGMHHEVQHRKKAVESKKPFGC
jgi:hypothetical protein